MSRLLFIVRNIVPSAWFAVHAFHRSGPPRIALDSQQIVASAASRMQPVKYIQSVLDPVVVYLGPIRM